MEIATWKIEKELWQNGWDFVIGVDEAGRGPLAGPVVAGAVAVREKQNLNDKSQAEQWRLIRDSKTLSEKQREIAYKFIEDNFFVGVGICNHKTVDRINILEASFLAMKMAITNLMEKKFGRAIILVDGNKKIPNFSEEQKAIIQGDKKVKSISAASIIAKVTRDEIMLKAHQKYPQYGFNRHKGYGTKIHMEALQKYGSCEIHRQSFKPVKAVSKEY